MSQFDQRSREDLLCEKQIDFEKRSQENEPDSDDTTLEIELEKPYNHYGSRGVADLFVRSRDSAGVEWDGVYEMKSDAAINESTGANEILRQFHRMCRYFYDGVEEGFPRSSLSVRGRVGFELCFDATPRTYQHILDNNKLYQEINQPTVRGRAKGSSSVTIRSLTEPSPVLVASSSDLVHSREDIVGMAHSLFGDDHEMFDGVEDGEWR